MSTVRQFDYSATISNALIWRHNNAAALEQIVLAEQQYYDTYVDQYLQDWYTNVFNLDTANEFGLTVWSIILNVPITISSEETDEDIFGFDDNGTENFDQAPFAPDSSDIVLTPEDARLALKLRYRTLTTNASVFNVNRILEDVFSALGIVYVVDNGDMTGTYVFSFDISYGLFTLFNTYNILPKPAGVAITIVLPP